jgi:hypothetical protein
VELTKSLWNLCDYFVPVWPYLMICLNLTYWVVLACNPNLANSMLIIKESSMGAFLLTTLYLIYLIIPLHIIYFLHLLSINHKCTQPCYFPLVLKPTAQKEMWTRILWRGVLGYASPRLPFLWCYGAFRYFISQRVILVFKDIIYVIIILYIMTFGYL